MAGERKKIPGRPYSDLSMSELEDKLGDQLRTGRGESLGNWLDQGKAAMNQSNYSVWPNGYVFSSNASTTWDQVVYNPPYTIGGDYPSYDITYRAVWDPGKRGYVAEDVRAGAPGRTPVRLSEAAALPDDDPEITWLRRRVDEICWKPM